MMMDPEGHHHHKTGHSWVDMFVAVCALLVSAISLGVAIFHGRTMEHMADANARLVQANSWPFLQASPSNSNDAGKPEISLAVENGGVGPAKVHWLELYYHGRLVADLRSMIAACCKPAAPRTPVPLDFNVSTTTTSGVLRAGQSVKLFALTRDDRNAAIWDRLNVERLNLSYRVCYCSVFDECWISDLRTLEPRSVKVCPVPKAAFDPLAGSPLRPSSADPSGPARAAAGRSGG